MEQLFDQSELVNSTLKANADALLAELNWFEKVLQLRSAINAGSVAESTSIFDVQPPDLSQSNSSYGRFLVQHQLGFADRFFAFSGHGNPDQAAMPGYIFGTESANRPDLHRVWR